MRLSAGETQDQYYAFTARLSARGQQRTAMRLVAACALCLAVPATLGALVPETTSVPGGHAALGVIAASCLVAGVLWLRHRWPTRAESCAVVVGAAPALALGCLLPADPLVGLLVAVAFALLLGFTALFHSRRLLTFVCAVSGLTIAWLWTRIAVDETATAVAVVIPLLLLCVSVTYACRTIADVGGNRYSPGDLEPTTGLLTRAAFHDEAATVLGSRHRDDDRFLVLVAIAIDSLAAIHSIHGARGVHAARVTAGQALRDTVRRDAALAHVGEAEFFIADTFTAPDPDPLIERIRGSIASTPLGLTASIGVVSTPLRPLVGRPPLEVLDEMSALATTAMFEARRAGGNQARYLLNPKLSGDDDPRPGDV